MLALVRARVGVFDFVEWGDICDTYVTAMFVLRELYQDYSFYKLNFRRV